MTAPRGLRRTMAKPSTRKLKVFQAQFGFHDSVVAAPSRVAALRAWGVHQNLFADGQARITDDAQAVAAARAHPETPLQRPLGSNDPFELDPGALPAVPDAPRQPVATKAAARRKPKPRPKPPPDRSRLDAAETALRQLDDSRKREEAELKRRQQALDDELSLARTAYVDARRQAAQAIAEARQAYRKAGGEP